MPKFNIIDGIVYAGLCCVNKGNFIDENWRKIQKSFDDNKSQSNATANTFAACFCNILVSMQCVVIACHCSNSFNEV